jgi:hypothetical protein
VLVFRSPLPPCTYAADAPAGSCYAKNEWVLTEASLGATVGPLGHHSDVLLRRARSASAPKRSCRRQGAKTALCQEWRLRLGYWTKVQLARLAEGGSIALRGISLRGLRTHEVTRWQWFLEYAPSSSRQFQERHQES